MWEENVVVVRRVNDAFHAADWDAALGLYDDEAELDMTRMPAGDVYQGPERRGSLGAQSGARLLRQGGRGMRTIKRLLALGAAVAAMALFAAPASAGPPQQASCQGIGTSALATAGELQNGAVAGFVQELGHEVFADFQQDYAHLHGSC